MPPENETPRYSSKTLGALAGVSERTVRYYVQEGLLPPPLSRGRGANFDDSHLLRLRLIRAMQDAGNDLESIGAYLEELEAELAVSGASLESVLAVWSGRGELAALRKNWAQRFDVPQVLSRYRLAEGVDLIIDARAELPRARLQKILKALHDLLQED